MARVTVEDCIRQVPSRFELILMAATRSRQISSGQPLLVERDRDRDPIVALREIADGKITAEEMNEKIISDLSQHVSIDETALENKDISEPDDAKMSEEEMLQSLTALEAKTNQSSYANVATDEAEFEYKNNEQRIAEPTAEMIAEEEIRIAEEKLEKSEMSEAKLPSDELPSDELPSDELPSDELPSDELPSDELPPDDPSKSDDSTI